MGAKNDILRALIDHYAGGNKSRFAAKLGVTPQAVSTWEKRNTFDVELIFAKCEGLDARWLLTGEGRMMASEQDGRQSSGDPIVDRLLAIIAEKDQRLVQQARELGKIQADLDAHRGG